MKPVPANIMDLSKMATEVFKEYANCRGYQDIILDGKIGSVNAVVADKAYSQNKNLYLGLLSKESHHISLLSVMYTTACKLLSNSPAGHLPQYEAGQRIYCFDKRYKWEYVFRQNEPKLIRTIKDGVRRNKVDELSKLLNDYFVVYNDERQDVKHSKQLNSFQEFYETLIDTEDHAPSFFEKKIMVVCNKGNLIQQLKDLDIYHCFPILCLTASLSDFSERSLPLDPLIILSSDYETAREYILQNNDSWEIDYLIVSTDTCIRKYKSQLKNDHANGIINKYCLIGTDIIHEDNVLSLWHWDRSEEGMIGGFKEFEWEMEPVGQNDLLSNKVTQFYEFLDELKYDFGSLQHFEKLNYHLHIILGDKLGKIQNFDFEVSKTRDEIVKSLLSDNYEEDDFKEDLDKAFALLKDILNEKNRCSDYLETLVSKRCENKALVVHKQNYDYWKDKYLERFDQCYNILTYKEVIKKIESPLGHSEFIFTYMPSLSQTKKLKMMLKKKVVTLRMCLYASEIGILQARLKGIQKSYCSTVGSKDSSLFPELDFDIGYRESGDDIIDRIEAQNLTYSDSLDWGGDYDYSRTSFTIQAKDIENKLATISTPQKILKDSEGYWVLTAVKDLKAGDIIKIYSNKSRESVFQTLTKDHPVYEDIYKCSEQWKRCIIVYIYNLMEILNEHQASKYSSSQEEYDRRIKELERYLNKSWDNIQKQWLVTDASTLFPTKKTLERILHFFNEKECLSIEEVQKIKTARRTYMGTTISLGQKLSTEAHQVLLSNDGDLEYYINKQVVGNKKQYPFLYSFDVSNIMQFLEDNFDQYTFERIEEEKEQDEDDE